MGLADVQRLLVHVYTDPAVEDRFLEDPLRTAAAFDVPREDDLAVCLDPEQVRFFNSSLRRKRVSILRRYVPLTVRSLGATFDNMFSEYSSATPLQGLRPYRDDALGFCRFVEGTGLEHSARETARFERTWLEVNGAGRVFAIRLFWRGYGGVSRPFIAVWLRLSRRGELRHALMPLWPSKHSSKS